MSVLADDDVVMHGNIECLGGVDQLLGHVDISAMASGRRTGGYGRG